MDAKSRGKKESGKLILGALVAITACTLLFNMLAEGVMAAELGKTEKVATNYSVIPVAAARGVPSGYKKAGYTAIPDPLNMEMKPTAKDITLEEAAELGAQILWEIWGVELEGATFYMGYNPGTDTFPRAFWSGDVRFGAREKPDGTPGIHGYGFMLDAVTGDRFSGVWERTLPVSVPLGPDADLAKNPQPYIGLARELSEKHHFVRGGVQSCEYGGQGYSNNDPLIMISVAGADGGKAVLTFSRYDEKFMGVIYPDSLNITEAAQEKYLAGIQKHAEGKQQESGSSPPSMVALP